VLEPEQRPRRSAVGACVTSKPETPSLARGWCSITSTRGGSVLPAPGRNRSAGLSRRALATNGAPREPSGLRWVGPAAPRVGPVVLVTFPNFDAAEIRTGTHYIDLFWKNVYIELKTARRLGPRERAQLAECAAYAKATGSNLAYVFLIKPTEHTVDLIKKAGGYVYYLFD